MADFDDTDALQLTETFEGERPRLRAMATRVLGSGHDADDALQEAWLRASRAGLDGVENPQGWLTTIVARICLDSLRARRPDAGPPDDAHLAAATLEPGPEDAAIAADAVGAALGVVLDSLEPNQRLAFMLHDVFAVPFEEVAQILGKSVVASRQLASRARAAVRAASPATPKEPDRERTTREVVDAFLVASRTGDLPGLLELLAPDVIARSDAAASAMGSPAAIAGRDRVAAFYDGKAVAIRRATVDGAPGAAWTHQGELKVVFEFVVIDGLIQSIDLLAVPEVLAATELELLRRE
jgi:RNA polymerase sigma factor (sigma-70 family)